MRSKRALIRGSHLRSWFPCVPPPTTSHASPCVYHSCGRAGVSPLIGAGSRPQRHVSGHPPCPRRSSSRGAMCSHGFVSMQGYAARVWAVQLRCDARHVPLVVPRLIEERFSDIYNSSITGNVISASKRSCRSIHVGSIPLHGRQRAARRSLWRAWAYLRWSTHPVR